MSLIRECLEIALQAPTGSNRQGWQWLVVDDAEIRRRIGAVYREVTERYLASGTSAARLFGDDPKRYADAKARKASFKPAYGKPGGKPGGAKPYGKPRGDRPEGGGRPGGDGPRGGPKGPRTR